MKTIEIEYLVEWFEKPRWVRLVWLGVEYIYDGRWSTERVCDEPPAPCRVLDEAADLYREKTKSSRPKDLTEYELAAAYNGANGSGCLQAVARATLARHNAQQAWDEEHGG